MTAIDSPTSAYHYNLRDSTALQESREAAKNETFDMLQHSIIETRLDAIQSPEYPPASQILSWCEILASDDYKKLVHAFQDLDNNNYQDDCEALINKLVAATSGEYQKWRKSQKLESQTEKNQYEDILRQSLLSNPSIQQWYVRYSLRSLTDRVRSPSNLINMKWIVRLFKKADERYGYAKKLFAFPNVSKSTRDIYGPYNKYFHDLKLSIYLMILDPQGTGNNIWLSNLQTFLEDIKTLVNMNTSVNGNNIGDEVFIQALIDKKTDYQNNGQIIDVEKTIEAITGKKKTANLTNKSEHRSWWSKISTSDTSDATWWWDVSRTHGSDSWDEEEIVTRISWERTTGNTNVDQIKAKRKARRRGAQSTPTAPSISESDTPTQEEHDTSTSPETNTSQNNTPSDETDNSSKENTSTPPENDEHKEKENQTVIIHQNEDNRNKEQYGFAVMDNDIQVTQEQIKAFQSLQQFIGLKKHKNYVTISNKEGDIFTIKNLDPSYENSPNHKNPTDKEKQKNNVAMQQKRNALTPVQLKAMGWEKEWDYKIKWIGTWEKQAQNASEQKKEAEKKKNVEKKNNAERISCDYRIDDKKVSSYLSQVTGTKETVSITDRKITIGNQTASISWKTITGLSKEYSYQIDQGVLEFIK